MRDQLKSLLGKKEEETTLTAVPPLSTILGMVEGQLVVITDNYHKDIYVVYELYDDYAILNDSSSKVLHLNLREVEKKIENKQLFLLQKDGKPALGVKKTVKWKRRWYVE
jgi:hypothetical protein